MAFQERMNRRSVVIGIGAGAVAVGGVATAKLAMAQTPAASPVDATPVASPVAFPQGPLGVQLQWLQEALNTEGGPTADEVAAHLAPAAVDLPPAEVIAATIGELGAEGGPYTIDTTTMIMTMDFPPTNASFTMNGESGGTLQGGMSIDRDSGLIRGLLLEPGGDSTPEASPAIVS